MRARWQELENVIDLLSKALGKHFISFIQDKHFDVVGFESAAVDHVKDSSGGANYNVDTILEAFHIFAEWSTSNAGMAFDVHEVSEGDDDFLGLASKFTGGCENEGLYLLQRDIDFLKDGDGKGGSFAGTRVSLSDYVVALDYWDNCTLLNSRGSLETMTASDTYQLRGLPTHERRYLVGARVEDPYHQSCRQFHSSWTK